MRKKTGLFIGRFQPFHNSHLECLKQIAKETENIIIGIGSAQHSHTKENPFNINERQIMVEMSVRKNLEHYIIVPIPDIGNYSRWVEHVEQLCPHFDVAYTGNVIVRELFEKKGYEVKTPETPNNPVRFASASEIRRRISRGENWRDYVPPETYAVIKDIKGEERIKDIYGKDRLLFPRTAADIVIESYNTEKEFQGIILIRRKYAPKGIAFPGGMQEYGESIEQTAVREAKEETGLDVIALEPLEFRSEPKRDPRGHTNSMVFIARAYGHPKRGSDAKEVYVLNPEKINRLKAQMVFDHASIWESYLKKRGTGK